VATTQVAIGKVAKSGATGRGISRSSAVGVPFPIVGRQQSAVADPIAVPETPPDADAIGQHAPAGTQQTDVIGVAAASSSTATTRAEAACNLDLRARPALDDMPGG